MALKVCPPRLKPFIGLHEPWSRQEKKCGDKYFSTVEIALSTVLPFRKSLPYVITSRCLRRSCLGKLSWKRQSSGNRLLKFLRLKGVFTRDLNTSIAALQYHLKTDVPKSGNRKLLFDTHAVVQLLEENGFSTQQAEEIVKILVRTTSSTMDTIYSEMVTKVQQEIMLQRIMSQIAAVKKDMIILEKSEFSTLLAENEKVKIQLLQLKVQLADVMNKVRSESLLDMNHEKSRVKEMKAEHERKLLEARTEIIEMHAELDRHLTQTNMRIDTEVAGLKTMLESHKLDTIKYLAGSVFTCLTVVLGFYRIWM